MSMHALLLIAALACAACHETEVKPASERPAADPALFGDPERTPKVSPHILAFSLN